MLFEDQVGALTFCYRDREEKVSRKRVHVIRVFYDSVPWHAGRHWFLLCRDLDAGTDCSYMMSRMSDIDEEEPKEKS